MLADVDRALEKINENLPSQIRVLGETELNRISWIKACLHSLSRSFIFHAFLALICKFLFIFQIHFVHVFFSFAQHFFINVNFSLTLLPTGLPQILGNLECHEIWFCEISSMIDPWINNNFIVKTFLHISNGILKFQSILHL